MRDDIDLNHFRSLLEQQRQTLEDTRADLESAGATVELDQQRVGRLSRMDALQMQAMAQAEQQRALLQRAQITAALARIESGDYGDCTECDEPIATGRLEADPSAPMCIECAEKTGG